MLDYPYPDPVAFQFGNFAIHWYGLMYVVGGALSWWLGRIQCKLPTNQWTKHMVDDAVFYSIIGAIIGGRIGYILFYNFDYFASDPLAILRIWQGGMSFHGGLIGVALALVLLARRYRFDFFAITDFVAPCAPIALAAGRLGNFINSELWGKIAPPDSYFGMRLYDPVAGEYVVRYPSQLLEMMLEGVLLWIILWFLIRAHLPRMAMTGAFLCGYAIMRSTAEIWRVPDAHIGYLYGNWLTMGQMLSLPMLALGAAFLGLAWARKTRLP